ncbi:hypothetical protein FSOLCH5_014791 [Fusarium solani]|jgi:hypothetical protein
MFVIAGERPQQSGPWWSLNVVRVDGGIMVTALRLRHVREGWANGLSASIIGCRVVSVVGRHRVPSPETTQATRPPLSSMIHSTPFIEVPPLDRPLYLTPFPPAATPVGALVPWPHVSTNHTPSRLSTWLLRQPIRSPQRPSPASPAAD